MIRDPHSAVRSPRIQLVARTADRGLEFGNRGNNDLDFLTAERARFASVRVESGDRDARLRVAASLEPDLTVGPPRPAGLPLKVSQPVRLGERKVDGQTLTGSRVEATIPAGAMGNEQPVKMSAEQWYGRDLQVVVEATYKDPRTGETRYRLREIQRAEPDARLFRPESQSPPGGAPRGVPPRR